jgi:hypothetical protein
VLPALFDRRQSAVVDELDRATDRLVAAAGPGVTAVVEAARITDARRRIGAGHLRRLREGVDGVPILMVPELFTRATGRRVVTLVADALAEELE